MDVSSEIAERIERRLDALRRSGRLVVDVEGEGGAVLERGHLADAWASGDGPHLGGTLPWTVADPAPDADPDAPLARDAVDELAWVAQWLERRAGRARVIEAGAGLAWPTARMPAFEIGTRLAS